MKDRDSERSFTICQVKNPEENFSPGELTPLVLWETAFKDCLTAKVASSVRLFIFKYRVSLKRQQSITYGCGYT